ncbi:MauE/DoxX family redox-associated membrane protein [Olivibacter sp. XZL3]|uniref:MauE/DoxX family redox-associated membrane protein n=1 Tax=Olivibacter sp. XZL3 TaxID=1735116 RepID=UPI001065217F|nr:MauE/DoxX family redox-associated membrane protein [Olivibacter sp. XZL3]
MIKKVLEKWTPFILETIVRATFILLYSYTAAMKLADFDVYRIKMHRQVFPNWLTEVLIYALPATELMMSIWLFLPFFFERKVLRFGLKANVLLMACFTVYAWLAKEKIFGYIPCACGGIFEKMEWPEHYVWNLRLTILAVGGACLQYWSKFRLITNKLYTRWFGRTHRAQKVLPHQ